MIVRANGDYGTWDIAEYPANTMPVKKQVLFLEQKRGGGK